MRRHLLCLAAIAVLASCNTGQDLRLMTRFSRVERLRLGAPVQISGVKVGTVTTIKPLEGFYYVEMRFTAPAPRIPSDANTRIFRTGLLGENYIDIDPSQAKGPPAKNNDLLPVAEN